MFATPFFVPRQGQSPQPVPDLRTTKTGLPGPAAVDATSLQVSMRVKEGQLCSELFAKVPGCVLALEQGQSVQRRGLDEDHVPERPLQKAREPRQ